MYESGMFRLVGGLALLYRLVLQREKKSMLGGVPMAFKE